MSGARRRLYTPLRLAAVRWRSGSSAVIGYEPLGRAPPLPPGVFVHLWVPGLESIPLAPVEAPGEVRFYVKTRGETTGRLVERPPVRAGMIGPMGAEYRVEALERAVLVAGGTGLAALAPLARSLAGLGVETLVLHGVGSASEAPPPHLLLPRRVEYKLATIDGSAGFQGTVVDLLLEENLHVSADLVVAAGPEGMLCSLYRVARRSGFLGRLVLGLETMVRCGMGFCGSCRVPCTQYLLCRDGVFYPARLLGCWAGERCGDAGASVVDSSAPGKV